MLQGRTSGFASNSATGVLQQWRRASRSTTDNLHHRTRRLRLFSLYKLKSGDRIESSKKRIPIGLQNLLEWRVTSEQAQTKLNFFVFLVLYGNIFFFKLDYLLCLRSVIYIKAVISLWFWHIIRFFRPGGEIHLYVWWSEAYLWHLVLPFTQVLIKQHCLTFIIDLKLHTTICLISIWLFAYLFPECCQKKKHLVFF